MQRVLVAVLVALALLQPVRPQVGAQETEDNHSTSSELVRCTLHVLQCLTMWTGMYNTGIYVCNAYSCIY